MRVIRWKNAVTGVESLNITATGIYFPVGKTDSSFIARYSMVSAGQTASVERVSSPNGSRVGSPAINVSGTTEVVVNERRGLSTGIIVTAISGTLISILDDNTPITNFPDAGLGRFPAKEDADAYVYGAIVPQGLPVTINSTQYTYGAAGWVGERAPSIVGLLGDSLTDSYSSAPALALASVGRLIVSKAQSGKKTADMATDVRLNGLMVCRDVYVQVGTNDVLTSDSIATIYSRYLDLFVRIKSRGHRLFVTLIPYASTNYSGTALANLAAFYAAKDAFADGVFDPYTELMEADGTASYASADGVHPSNSARSTIAAVYSAKIKGLIFAHPQVRYNTESLLLNGCFLTDSNADGLADSWNASSSGTITTIAPSLSAADSLGYKKQQFGISALTGPGSHSLYQDVTTGFVAGDLIRAQSLVEASIPDAYNDSIWAMMIITCRNSGGSTILSSNPLETNNRTSVTSGQIQQSWDFVVPAETASIRVNLSLRSLGAAAISSLCTAAFSRAGLYNLTAAGIPASSAITKSY